MKRQVIVVGAGPGGSTAAFYFAKKGIDVLLLDRETWPREKPCGGTYLPVCYPMFEEMGVLEEMRSVAELSSTKVRLILHDEANGEFSTKPKLNMPRRYGDDCIRRSALRAGADFMENFDVTELIMQKGMVKGVKGYYHNQEMTIESDLVIVADGAHSVLSNQLGAFENDPERVMYCFRSMMTGVEGLEGDVIEQYYLPDTLPNEAHSPICVFWLSPQKSGVALFGVTITEKALRDSKLSIEELVEVWSTTTEFGKKRMKNAKVLDDYGFRGWRLPGCAKLHKSYYPGAIIIGDAISAAECAFEYGIPEAMFGGKIAAEVGAEIFAANGTFDEESLVEYQRRAEAQLNPTLEFNAIFRTELLDHKDRLDAFLKWAKEQPGYPDNDFGANVAQFITTELKIPLKVGGEASMQ